MKLIDVRGMVLDLDKVPTRPKSAAPPRCRVVPTGVRYLDDEGEAVEQTAVVEYPAPH